MPDVVLIGKEWKLRALLRAQLLEEGIAVEAYETPADAAYAAASGPALIIADITSSGNPESELESLAHWARFRPTWVVASSVKEGVNPERFERVIYKPLRLGDLISEIEDRLRRRRQS